VFLPVRDPFLHFTGVTHSSFQIKKAVTAFGAATASFIELIER
jgi:hypothetical protein